jgi:hypothetical protein
MKMSAVCSDHNEVICVRHWQVAFLTNKWFDKKNPPEEETLPMVADEAWNDFIDAAGGWKHYQNLLKSVKKKIADETWCFHSEYS